MDNPEVITVLSLCSGYGGLELGLSAALANPLRVVAVEIEAYALANLVAKAEEGKLAVEALWPDLRTFPAERFRGCFDFILAGYPCQPFSVAGKRQGTDDPRHLWPSIARIVAAVEPVWCFFENVPGHLSLGFPDVYQSLRNMGYSVEGGLFTAAECGAPHKRQRLFVLSHHSGPRCTRAEDAGTNRRDATEEQGGCTKSQRSCELADREPLRPAQPQGRKPEQRRRVIDGGEAMADAPAQRVQGPEPTGPILAGRQTQQQGGADRWPARPGEPQYEWEEPRVIVEHTEKHRNSAVQQQGQRAGVEQASTVGNTSSRLSGRRRKQAISQSEGQGNSNRQQTDGTDILNSSTRSTEEQTKSVVG